MSPLTIYKASAGSGKTYQLTLAYLDLLFRYPESYRHILAVTFTNKAASEMKSRILDRLHDLSRLKGSESSDDLAALMNSTGLSNEEIIKTAATLLTKILNDYSRFSVGTIDRFFQGVIRAFTREIGLPAGFNLELDRDRILGEAIDRMFLELDTDIELLHWMLRFAESRIEASQGWDFRNDIVNLGKELFSEAYQEIMLESESKIDREILKNFISFLEEQKDTVQSDITELAKTQDQNIIKKGYTLDDFHRKTSGPAGYFQKASHAENINFTETLVAACSDIEKWISKNEDDQAKIGFIRSELMPALSDIYTRSIYLNTLIQVSQYVYALGILGDLSERILDLTDEKNLFLLSDSSRFLRGLIGNNPTPFIYEKTGNFIDHILLDEFQDTSIFQWENFQPLMNHTLSYSKENMIVGDVKQSIYRWRNSDWKIMAEEIENEFKEFPIEHKQLNTNWRSTKHIVHFNNALFTEASKMIMVLIQSAMNEARLPIDFLEKWGKLLDVAYREVRQELPESASATGGYIRGEILATEGFKLKDLALEALKGWIIELQDSGFAAGDIAILVRTNKEGAEVAAQLMQAANETESGGYNFKFVSNESLFLNNNPAVRLLLSLLTYISEEENALNNLALSYFYQRVSKSPDQGLNSVLNPDYTILNEWSPEFIRKLKELEKLPLYEVIDSLIEMFKLENKAENLPYIQAFQEIVLEMQQNDPGSLHDFLQYWKEFGKTKSIQASDQQDAIRIITIHKAKGLQFKAVLVPFCDWSLSTAGSGTNDTILWCKTAGTPFEEVPVVPLKFRRALKDTLFASSYFEELIMGYIDTLNLLYVALTRAEEAMIIGLPAKPQKGNLSNVGHLCLQAVEAGDFSLFGTVNKLETTIDESGFVFGELNTKKVPRVDEDSDWTINSYPVNLRKDSIRLRLKSRDYFLKSESDVHSHLDFGNIMHEIFSRIHTMQDIEQAVNSFYNDGLLGERDADRLKTLIREKIESMELIDWYQEGSEILNERDIFEEGETFRPDRVMINDGNAIVLDYKFGDEENQGHIRQVRKYMRLLNQMNYRSVKGYLWYVMQNDLIEVL